MSVRFGVKENMLATLASMLSAAGIKQVERQKTEVFDNYKFPLAFVNDSSESRTRVLLDCIRVDWSVVVVAYDVAGKTPSTKLNSLIETVKQAILSDVTLGGGAYNVRILRIDTDEGFANPYVIAVFVVSVTYLSET